MDYERKYKEALEKAQKALEVCWTDKCETARQIFSLFPELKESKDERIRKEIIATIHLYYGEPLEDETKEMIAWLEKQGEQNPTECIKFGNEFENQISHLLVSVLNREYEYNEGFVKYVAQSLLGYAKNELKPIEWSEEDEKMVNDIIAAIDTLYYHGMVSWLKSIKDRVQPKQGWSEKDSPYYDDICEILINLLHSETAYVNKDAIQKDLDWLKSLKQRIGWEPSDEQMKALNDLNLTGNISYAGQGQILIELYNDLKKLTE